MANTFTQAELKRMAHCCALIETVSENAETGTPTNIVYLAFQMHGVGYLEFQEIIEAVIRAGLVENRNHTLYPTVKLAAVRRMQ